MRSTLRDNIEYASDLSPHLKHESCHANNGNTLKNQTKTARVKRMYHLYALAHDLSAVLEKRDRSVSSDLMIKAINRQYPET